MITLIIQQVINKKFKKNFKPKLIEKVKNEKIEV